jgi:hypothetical protein
LENQRREIQPCQKRRVYIRKKFCGTHGLNFLKKNVELGWDGFGSFSVEVLLSTGGENFYLRVLFFTTLINHIFVYFCFSLLFFDINLLTSCRCTKWI